MRDTSSLNGSDSDDASENTSATLSDDEEFYKNIKKERDNVVGNNAHSDHADANDTSDATDDVFAEQTYSSSKNLKKEPRK